MTRCVRPESRRNIRAASAASSGLPRIVLSRVTVVSAPRTTREDCRFDWLLVETGGGEIAKNGFGFFPRQPRDVGNGILAGQRIFRDVRRMHLETVAGLREQFAASRRSGSENQHDGIMAGLPPFVQLDWKGLAHAERPGHRQGIRIECISISIFRRRGSLDAYVCGAAGAAGGVARARPRAAVSMVHAAMVLMALSMLAGRLLFGRMPPIASRVDFPGAGRSGCDRCPARGGGDGAAGI